MGSFNFWGGGFFAGGGLGGGPFFFWSPRLLAFWRILDAASSTGPIATAAKYAQCRNYLRGRGCRMCAGPFEAGECRKARTVTDTDVITEPQPVYFGYTFCPDVCPLDVDRNAPRRPMKL